MKKARLTEKQTLYTRCVPRAGRSLNQRRKAQINNRLRSQLDESSVAGQMIYSIAVVKGTLWASSPFMRPTGQVHT